MMSEGIYRKVYVRMWKDRQIRSLSPMPPSGQGLWLLLLAGEHTSPVPGLLAVGRAAFAESIGWEIEDFDRCFSEVEAQGLAFADWKQRLIWLPGAWDTNGPDNPNQVLRYGRLFREYIPECELSDQAIRALYDHCVERDKEKGKNSFQSAFFEAFGNVPANVPINVEADVRPNVAPNPTPDHGVNGEAEKGSGKGEAEKGKEKRAGAREPATPPPSRPRPRPVLSLEELATLEVDDAVRDGGWQESLHPVAVIFREYAAARTSVGCTAPSWPRVARDIACAYLVAKRRQEDPDDPVIESPVDLLCGVIEYCAKSDWRHEGKKGQNRLLEHYLVFGGPQFTDWGDKLEMHRTYAHEWRQKQQPARPRPVEDDEPLSPEDEAAIRELLEVAI